jgi:hypothetical protein
MESAEALGQQIAAMASSAKASHELTGEAARRLFQLVEGLEDLLPTMERDTRRQQFPTVAPAGAVSAFGRLTHD